MAVIVQNSAIRRARLVRRFREAGALDPEHAVTLESLGEDPSLVFEQMTSRGVFLPTEDGRFYMDERAAAEYIDDARSLGWIVAGALILVFLLVWFCGRSGK